MNIHEILETIKPYYNATIPHNVLYEWLRINRGLDEAYPSYGIKDDDYGINIKNSSRHFAGGALSGGIEGTLRGINEGKNPLETAAYDSAIGLLTGVVGGYGLGKIGQKFAKNALQDATSDVLGKYYDDYIEGLNNPTKSLADMRAQRMLGGDAGGGDNVFDNTNPEHLKQFQIIKNTNPAPDSYHTWIRTADDINYPKQLFSEANKKLLENPDWTLKDMKNALKNGEITIYSSY